MQDLPNPEQLLAAVARFLRDEAGPALARHGDSALAYQARVAANMVDTVARQTTQALAADAAEVCRLQVLLGLPGEADLGVLNSRLASRIADGTISSDQPGLAEHLWATTLAKLAVDQPGYDTFVRHQPTATPAATP